ncbi:MAG: DUF6913 domain-containing protein [Bacteroidota bacterium]
MKKFLIQQKTKSNINQKQQLYSTDENRIALVFDADTINLNDLVAAVELYLDVADNSIECFGFTNDKEKIAAQHNALFSKKEFNLLGKIKSTRLNDKINQDYRLKINFFIGKNIFLEHISSQLKAELSIGLPYEKIQLNDLTINVKSSEINLFFKEAAKYIQLIKTK